MMLAAKNKKHGILYDIVSDEAVCTTNRFEGTRLVVYMAQAGHQLFVRDYEEFCEKFDEITLPSTEIPDPQELKNYALRLERMLMSNITKMRGGNLTEFIEAKKHLELLFQIRIDDELKMLGVRND